MAQINSGTDALNEIIRILQGPGAHSYHATQELLDIAKAGLIAESNLARFGLTRSGIVIPWPESSSITKTTYYPDTFQLVVHLKNGSAYQYFPFPADQWEALKKTDSIGRFYASSIKKEYNYKQVL